jgi:hypothetical protein
MLLREGFIDPGAKDAVKLCRKMIQRNRIKFELIQDQKGWL